VVKDFFQFLKNETAGCEGDKCGDIKAIRIFSIYSAFIYFAFEKFSRREPREIAAE
jgi:hypothetical protein